MDADSVKYAVVILNFEERPVVDRGFVDRASFRAYVRDLELSTIPYCTFELRERHGKMLWHPTETRFFDPNGKR
jgi:hypothetical protein